MPNEVSASDVSMPSELEDFARFVGTWTLISYELLMPWGMLEKPMGEQPLGQLMYLASGHMSAQVMASGVNPLANADSRMATQEEAARVWRNYVGYWGTFTVDADAGVVIHAVEGAWFPNWIGEKQVRQYRFSANTLTLETKSADWYAKLIWRRAE